jgi:mRNA interferase MazF
MNCRRGDVILVLFPDSNLRTSKRRPALVVQADQLGAGLPQTIVAMITSNMARAGHTSRVVVRVDSESAKGSGLLMDSVIMTGNLATIQSSEIDRILGGFSAPEGTRRSLASRLRVPMSGKSRGLCRLTGALIYKLG